MSYCLPPPEDVIRGVPCFCGSLLLAGRAVSRIYGEALRRAGLEGTQYSMLRVLEALGPVNQLELGERLAAERTTVSRAVKLLEKEGWVRVEPGEDRRERVVTISPKGRAVLKRAEPHWNEAQRRMREKLGAERFVQVHALLSEVSIAALRA